MLIGYTRICANDPEHALCSQMDALLGAGVDIDRIFHDEVVNPKEPRPALEGCLKALRTGDILVVSKLDRLGSNLRHLIKTIRILNQRDIDLRVLLGAARIDTAQQKGRLAYAVFEALAEFERDRISEGTRIGLEVARKQGRKGGRRFALTPEKVQAVQAALAHSQAKINDVCASFGISKATLYRYMDAQGQLREVGRRVMGELKRVDTREAK